MRRSTATTTASSSSSSSRRRNYYAGRVCFLLFFLLSIGAVIYLHSLSTRQDANSLELQFEDHFFLPSSLITTVSSSSSSVPSNSTIQSNQSNIHRQPRGHEPIITSSSLTNESSSFSSSSSSFIIPDLANMQDVHPPVDHEKMIHQDNTNQQNHHHHQDENTTSSSSFSFWYGLQQPFEHHGFPLWLQEYILWHDEMRTQFPGTDLWTNPKAPNILLRYCVHKCGGLQDRLGNLPTDLYFAHQTQRVLLIAWYHPYALEEFLQPHSFSTTTSTTTKTLMFNWSVPHNAPNLTTKKMVLKFHKDLFHQNPAMNVTHAIYQATEGDWKHEKVLLTRFLGCLHEEALEQRLVQEYGPDTDTLHHTPTFGKLFHALFRPSPSLALRLQDVTERLQLIPYHYAAVHCRVRHPGGYKYGKVIIGKLDEKGKVVGSADQVGLDFSGDIRRHAISVASHAIQCTTTMLQHMMQVDPAVQQEQQQLQLHHKKPSVREDYPIYFLADSEELVNYMVHHVPRNDTFLSSLVQATQTDSNANNASNITLEYNETIRTELEAHRVVSQTRLLSRPLIHPSVHLDRQKNVSVEAVQDVFVDLYLAMGAHCVSFGIGNFGFFVSKLSYYARTCRWQYQLTVSGKSNDFLRRNLTNLLPTSECTKDTLPRLQASIQSSRRRKQP